MGEHAELKLWNKTKVQEWTNYKFVPEFTGPEYLEDDDAGSSFIGQNWDLRMINDSTVDLRCCGSSLFKKISWQMIIERL